MKFFSFFLVFFFLFSLGNGQNSVCQQDTVALVRNGQVYLSASDEATQVHSKLHLGSANPSSHEGDQSLSVSGSIRQLEQTVRPDCDRDHRGSLYQQQGYPVQVCMKLIVRGRDSYHWVSLKQDNNFASNARGFQVKDAWGLYWDGLNRRRSSWDDAKETCENLGGRLPTATELYRNAAIGKESTISDEFPAGAAFGEYLWTSTKGVSAGQYIQVRLADGDTPDTPPTTAKYRCVWNPKTEPDTCHAPPGETCAEYDPFWLVDKWLRPPLPLISALDECNSYGGSLPTLKDLHALLASSKTSLLEGGNVWLADLYTHTTSIVGVMTSGTFSPENQFYTWTTAVPPPTTDPRPFFCIFKRPTITGVLPSPQGGFPCTNTTCFTINNGVGRMIFQQKPVAGVTTTWAPALEECMNTLGFIPAFNHFLQAWATGVFTTENQFVFSSSAVDYGSISSIPGYFRVRGFNDSYWDPATGSAVIATTGAAESVCAWRETVTAVLPTCTATQTLNFDGGSFSCSAVTPSPPGGSFNRTQDNFQYYFDQDFRQAANYSFASQTCEGLGGRLPTVGELARASSALGAEAVPLWTNIPASSSTRRTITLSGAVSIAGETAEISYRCVWPPQEQAGAVFGGNKCFGDSSDPCFKTDTLVFDRDNRPGLPLASAMAECTFLGGRLPSMEEAARLIHAGAPNTNIPIWTLNTDNVVSVGSAYILARWTGTSNDNWVLVPSYSVATTAQSFRCIFSSEIIQFFEYEDSFLECFKQ